MMLRINPLELGARRPPNDIPGTGWPERLRSRTQLIVSPARSYHSTSRQAQRSHYKPDPAEQSRSYAGDAPRDPGRGPYYDKGFTDEDVANVDQLLGQGRPFDAPITHVTSEHDTGCEGRRDHRSMTPRVFAGAEQRV